MKGTGCRKGGASIPCAAVVDVLEPRRLLAGESPVELLKDLSPANQSSIPPNTGYEFLAAGNLGFYTASYTVDSSSGGREVWRTDGTVEGTFLLKDIMPGPGSSEPRDLTDVGGTLFFAARTPEHGHELWKSDGTPGGTVMVKDIRPGPLLGTGGDFTAVGNRLIFSATDGVSGTELWVSDGTEAGTRMLADLTPGPGHTDVSTLASAGGQAFFGLVRADTGYELWRTDGTPQGTRIVKDVRPGPSGGFGGQMLAAGNLLYFIADDGVNGREIWRTDGTGAGTVPVTDLNFDVFSSPELLAAAGNTLFFRPTSGRLWKSDGTSAGTALVANLHPYDSVAVGNALYFVDRAGTRYKLWKTDGTPGGTVVVDNPAGDLDFGGPTLDINAAAWNGRLYFNARTPAHGWELWSTDGTTAGTRLLKDIAPGPATAGAGLLDRIAPAGDKLFFPAEVPGIGYEPWVTDGTEAGTRLVRDVNTVSFNTDPVALTRVGARAFFFTADGRGDFYVTDGTAAGTSRVKWVSLDTPDGRGPFTAGAGDTFFFHGSGREVGETHMSGTLWKSDGTAAGTTAVLYPPTGDRIHFPQGLKAIGGKVFFAAHDSSNRDHLWASDGTAAGTYKLFPLSSREIPVSLKKMVDVGGVAYFPQGRELWRSDGTPAGTYRVAVPFSATADAFVGQLTNLNGTLIFTVSDDASTNLLYRSGGTAETTQLVTALPAGPRRGHPTGIAAGELMIFDGPGGVWRSDGTAEGTFSVNAAVSLQGVDNLINTWAALGDRLIFAAPSGNVGWEPWVTDGTAAGTRLLKDIHPTGDSLPHFMVSAGGAVYFSANSGGGPFVQYDLWRTDGTPEGTQRVPWPAPSPTRPQYLVELNGEALFAGTDLGTPLGGGPGREVMKVRDLIPPSPRAGRFRYQGPHAWSVTFDEDVSATFGPEDLRVTNLTTAQDVPPAQWTVSESASPGSMVVTLRFAAGLPAGNYRVRVMSTGVADRAGNAMAADRTFDFFVLTGDVNRDRAVNGTDFALLAANFGRSGRTYAEGDLNGDGMVNGTDFALLAGNFGRALPEPAAAVVAPPPAPVAVKPQEAKRSRPVAPRRLAMPPPRAVRPTEASPLRRGLRAQRHRR